MEVSNPGFEEKRPNDVILLSILTISLHKKAYISQDSHDSSFTI